MASEKIVIKGQFRGFYTTTQSNNLGGADYFNLRWRNIILETGEQIGDYISSDLKTGLYSYLSSTTNFETSSEININNEDTIEDVVLKDYQIIKSLKDGNEIFVEVRGDYYARFPFIPPPPLPPQNTDETLDDELEKTNDPDSIYLKPLSVVFAVLLFFITLLIFQNPLIIILSLLISIYIFFFGRVERLRSPFFTILGLGLFLSLLGAMIHDHNYENKKVSYTYKSKKKSSSSSWNSSKKKSSSSSWNSSKSNDKSKYDYDDTEYETDNYVETSDFITNYLEWKDFSGNYYNEEFKVKKSYYYQSKNHREKISLSNSKTIAAFRSYFYETVHSNTFSFDQNKLQEVLKKYQSIKNTYNLNRLQFAKTIVSSVQSIPYNYIMPAECNDESLSKEIPCIENIKFGFYSPVEFISNFKGDCDTKALFLFYILDKFGYDVALLVSFQYQHAILGINLNVGGGKYVTHNKKRYYLWETTAIGWKPGMLNPKFANLNNFRVELINNI